MDKYMVACHRCGLVFPFGAPHLCKERIPKSDVPFAQIVQSSLPMLDTTTGRIVAKFQAELVDMEDRAIVDAVIRAAQDDAITTLCLMDKRFVLDAIREKMERM